MRNVVASIRDRLLNIARQEDIPFQRILTLYKQEGLLHRIVTTEYGLTFDQNSIVVGPISGQTEHGGVRGHILSYLGNARTRLQIDMGFSDIITGGPVRRPYRTLLENRAFTIQTYSGETVAAEKIEAIVSLGIINSRYKDLFDLFALLVNGEIPESDVINATTNTFTQRRTSLPENPESLSTRRWTSTEFDSEWGRFLKRIDADSPELPLIREELLPRLVRIYSAVRARILAPNT